MPKKTVSEKKSSVLDGLEFACPLSDFKLDGQKYVAHKANASICKTGRSLYLTCFMHGFQGFINNPDIVKRCIDAAHSTAP